MHGSRADYRYFHLIPDMKIPVAVFHSSDNLEGIKRNVRGDRHSARHQGGFKQHIVLIFSQRYFSVFQSK
jgi:hypothetical protein